MNVDLDGDAFRVRYGGRRLGDRLSSVDAGSCALMFLTAMRTTDKARDDLAMVSLASYPNPQTCSKQFSKQFSCAPFVVGPSIRRENGCCRSTEVELLNPISLSAEDS